MMYSTQATEDEKLDPVTRMTRWVDQVIGARYQKYRHDETWQPPINLYEDAESYCVVVDLAGVDAQSLDLRTEGGYLIAQTHSQAPESHYLTTIGFQYRKYQVLFLVYNLSAHHGHEDPVRHFKAKVRVAF